MVTRQNENPEHVAGKAVPGFWTSFPLFIRSLFVIGYSLILRLKRLYAAEADSRESTRMPPTMKKDSVPVRKFRAAARRAVIFHRQQFSLSSGTPAAVFSK